MSAASGNAGSLLRRHLTRVIQAIRKTQASFQFNIEDLAEQKYETDAPRRERLSNAQRRNSAKSHHGAINSTND